ncbi:MAG: response regulator [Anaerolineae bacterium]|nr:response regulator [Anaerolineae bacterium]
MPDKKKVRERILVVDDSSDIRDVLRDMILEPQGYVVLTARDGQEGLETALRERPDLILMDINMPRMTGLQVLQKLRDAKYEWPVIMMTSEGSEEIAVQAFRLGVRDYIPKPFDIESVLTAVDRVLVESQLRREREMLLRRLAAVNKQLQARMSELKTMYALGQALASVLDRDKLLNRVVEASVYLCHSDEGTLYLIEQESGDLYMTAAQGMGERASHGFHLRVSDSLVGQVVRSGEPITINSNSASPDLKVKTGYLVQAMMNVPLKVKDEVIGVLSVANRVRRRSFSPEDQNRLVALGNYASTAIENARLYDQTRRVAAADMLNRTVVTISHYINNPLMTLSMGMDRLTRSLEVGQIVDDGNMIAKTVRLAQIKVEEISSVISILRDVASPQFVTYMDNIEMLDIDAKLQQRLKEIKEKYKS